MGCMCTLNGDGRLFSMKKFLMALDHSRILMKALIIFFLNALLPGRFSRFSQYSVRNRSWVIGWFSAPTKAGRI